MKNRVVLQDKKRISGITVRSHVPELKYMRIKSKHLRCAEKKRVYSRFMHFSKKASTPTYRHSEIANGTEGYWM
jgi:hypothetical protein